MNNRFQGPNSSSRAISTHYFKHAAQDRLLISLLSAKLSCGHLVKPEETVQQVLKQHFACCSRKLVGTVRCSSLSRKGLIMIVGTKAQRT
jgi:hypothetical protein